MSSLFELANQALETPDFRREILASAFGEFTPEQEQRYLSRLHDNDRMLHHCLNHFGNINFSLSHYLAVTIQQYRIVEKIKNALFPKNPDAISMLDFACGYGRLQRLMSIKIDPELLWVSEINDTALAYVVKTFGVNGLDSCADPDRFSTTEKFDVIWVASLFSHLPRHLFNAWLERLASLLKPTGVLCFSVHDEKLLPSTTIMPDSGFYYIEQSEDANLDVSIYGTTYVSESFVAGAITALDDSAFGYHCIPKGLANEQDLYIVARHRLRDLSPLKNIRHGAWGFVDKVYFEPDGEFYLYGWAASIDDGVVDHVEIMIGDDVHCCPANLLRSDVVEVLKDPRLLNSGWEIRLRLAPAEHHFAAVTVVSKRGERSLVYAGFITEGRFSI
ncbi:MAG: class I SAM-dependent methyltransferase [Arenimonas sp.]